MRTKEHGEMKRECEKIAMGQRARQEPNVDEETLGMLYSRPNTVLYDSGHVCPRVDCPAQDSEVRLQFEYGELRDKHMQLEAKYQSLLAREMRMVERLSKLAQYELTALPHPWTAHLHSLGRTFYFNHETGVSSWHDPRQVPTPRVEGCPLWRHPASSDAYTVNDPDAPEKDNVDGELWGTDGGAEGGRGQVGMSGSARPSTARLTGLPVRIQERVLSESEFQLPTHSFSPAEEQVSRSTRQSGITIDTPRGSQMRGTLQVAGPSLHPPPPHRVGHTGTIKPEVVHDREEQGAWRMVRLDGDRVWLSTSLSSALPFKDAVHAPKSGMPQKPMEQGEQEGAEMQSIPLWKAKLEILYPRTEYDVSDILWGTGNVGAAHFDNKVSSDFASVPFAAQAHVSASTTASTVTHTNTASTAGSESASDTPDNGAEGQGGDKGFTRWRILDRMSRYWVFECGSKRLAREWVASLTHNMLLVDSGRIRPTNFHILAPLPGNARAPAAPTVNVTEQVRVGQLQGELQHSTSLLKHTQALLRDCVKAQKSESARTRGPQRSTPAQVHAEGNTVGNKLGNIVEQLQSDAAQRIVRNILHLPRLLSAPFPPSPPSPPSSPSPATNLISDLFFTSYLASPSSSSSTRTSTDTASLLDSNVVASSSEEARSDTQTGDRTLGVVVAPVVLLDRPQDALIETQSVSPIVIEKITQSMADGVADRRDAPQHLALEDVEQPLGRHAQDVVVEQPGMVAEQPDGRSPHAPLHLPPYTKPHSQRATEEHEQERLEERFGDALKRAGATVDDGCPSLYPPYVSFLRAQV